MPSNVAIAGNMGTRWPEANTTMHPSDVTNPGAVVEAIRECDRLGEDAFRRKYGRGPHTKYALVYEGRLYDPKAILAAAHFHQVGTRISESFAGGKQTNSRLTKLGFDIVEETASASAARGTARKQQFVGTPYRDQPLDVGTTDRAPFFVDPDVVDRGTRGHRQTQNLLAAALRGLALKPLRPEGGDPLCDLAWYSGKSLFVAEVKSVTETNEERQLRLGLGQVLRYRQLTRAAGPVIAVLAVERRPSDDDWIDLCDDLGVRLVWPEMFGPETLT